MKTSNLCITQEYHIEHDALGHSYTMKNQKQRMARRLRTLMTARAQKPSCRESCHVKVSQNSDHLRVSSTSAPEGPLTGNFTHFRHKLLLAAISSKAAGAEPTNHWHETETPKWTPPARDLQT